MQQSVDCFAQPLDPIVVPSSEGAAAGAPLEPTVVPPDIPARTALCGVAAGAVGFVQAVARARSAAPTANAAARRERTSMRTSEVRRRGIESIAGCEYVRFLHLAGQSRFGSLDRSFGRGHDPCS
jgi:hypothetical protein